MPELPEVETVRTGLEMALKGAVIRKATLRRKDLRIPFAKGFVEALAARKITAIRRRAKYLLFYLDNDDVLIAHLGMSGRFTICHPALVAGSGLDKVPDPAIRRGDKHDHVIFELADGRSLIFNDARRFGLMTLAKKSALKTHPLFAHLGPEPLDKEFSPEYLKTALARRKGPIKTVLMDQKLVVGVGNIYASEALFLARIDPRTPAHKTARKAEAIIDAVRQVLDAAIASGGSSLRDFLQVSGEAGYFQHSFNVYGRGGKPCFSCHIPLRGIRQAGRSTFFCATCQK